MPDEVRALPGEPVTRAEEDAAVTVELDRELAMLAYVPPRDLGQPVGLPWHAERGAPERPCGRCGVAAGQPCWVSVQVDA